MRRISSNLTFFYKIISLAIWLASIVGIGGLALYLGLTKRAADLLQFLPVIAIIIFLGYRSVKMRVFDAADEVWDDGDSLIVKNNGQEQRIPLTDIRNVSYSTLDNPTQVTVWLRRPMAFGDKVRFFGPTHLRILPLAPNPEIDDLIERFNKAGDSHSGR
ncbi:MAG TPA: hypothetical protein VMR17_14800 [Xanthobacteraceae bacterium]|jgi:hypothetical protein|nr:hypothetical protein [Xanthobacteraceae bacterium]